MEKRTKEVGWCPHVFIVTFYRLGGSTAIKICNPVTELYVWWLTQDVMTVACAACYRAENPIAAVEPRSAPRAADRSSPPRQPD